ncbi:glycoside hydrolase family 35 protein [Actinoallomurus rhizosphaericola]|uniref:glycoside hydrolase family 35 protein n=1 Tax=Actinoallomurus rhizosphaericola TaxID=2952536 RepID=UPI002092C3CF|nr:beta-galactosidase [Actinoallomurus rhizosphaericola]MCO5998916.1 beta-galactosidase [Actinoallomurus rhizosphaericola]
MRSLSRARRRLLLFVAVVLAVVGGGAVTLAARNGPDTPQPAHKAHTVAYDHYSLKLDGDRVYLWSAEFHYWRLPSPDLWLDVLQKFKAAGYNATSIYFDWAYHSPKQGVYDFTGVRDIDRLLDIAQQVGIYVIARPGPYINAETDSGGFPGWLTTQKGRARSSAPDYTAAYQEWLRHVDPIIARHQVTDGTGPVILYQIENEYGTHTDKAYMKDLKKQVRADGIDVPFTHNHCCGASKWATGGGSVDLPGQDSYPQKFNCSTPDRWNGLSTLPRFRDDAPIFTPEFQGGAYDPWGGSGYDKCRKLTGPDFEKVFYENNIATGVTMQNFYMTYGGTSWGWLADPSHVYTSYDYGSAIKEDRELTPKYDEAKRLGYLTQAVAPLTKTKSVSADGPTNTDVRLTARANPDDGTHFYVLRHRDATSTTTETTHLPIDLNAGGQGGTKPSYPSVPQEPGTSIKLAGRDSKLLVAGYRLGSQDLRYSTSEIMTHGRIGDRDVALLYGRRGEDGETVLHYDAEPSVTVLSGKVRHVWNAGRGDLRLNYTHQGLARVLVTPRGGVPVLLLLATDQEAARFWRQDTAAGPVLVRGPELVRSAAVQGSGLALTGDTSAPTDLEVFAAPSVRTVTWNGAPVRTAGNDTLTGRLAGPRPVTLPALTGWKVRAESPEARPGFDDHAWTVADHKTTNNPTPPATSPVLYADDYGFHHGDVWYRAHFTAKGRETGITLTAGTGKAGVYSAWLNGRFLGSGGDGRHTFAFPAGAVAKGRDNVLSVLVEDMGHNEDFDSTDTHKEPRGLTSAKLRGSAAPLTWRVQGSAGGETLPDPARGPFNTGGLFGERSGWYLPGGTGAGWTATTLPRRDKRPGISWYKTTFDLSLPKGQDVPLGVTFTDDKSRHYRALLFVNGWQLGRYVNDVGPQRSFPIPPGILRTDGRNTLAIAVWNEDGRTGGLGQVGLRQYADLATSLRVSDVTTPR